MIGITSKRNDWSGGLFMLPLVVAFMLSVTSSAVTRTWDDGGAGSDWTTAGNWSGDTVPAANDTAQINSGDTVNLNIEWPANPLEINLDGTMTQSGAMRLWDTRLTVGATATHDLTGGKWLVLWGGNTEVSFNSGATFIQDSGRIQFGNNANMTLRFNLAADGFETLSANLLHFDGHAGQTIEADMAAYTGGPGILVLMDLAGNNGLTDSIFQTNLTPQVANTGAYPGSYLRWNETTSAIELVVVASAPLTWDDGGAGSTFATAANWVGDVAPVSGADSVFFDTAVSSNTAFLTSPFTVGNGQLFAASGGSNYVFRITNNGHLTVASGGVLDFATNSGLVAEGSGTMRLTLEAGATASAWRFFDTAGYTTEFVADASGVTTFEITSGLFLSGNGALELDLTSYDLGNGQAVVLFDYPSGTPSGFASVTVTGASGSIDLAYDQGGGDKAIAFVYDTPHTWDDGGADTDWETADNWNYNAVPAAADDVLVPAGFSVTNAQREFTTLTVGAGADITFAEDLTGANVITSSGALDIAGVWRLNGASVSLTATGHLGSAITFFDTNGGSMAFVDGASFANSGMHFEHKGTNTFDFTLSASGFATLTAGVLFAGNNGSFVADWSRATYNIDISAYDRSNGLSIVLMDFSGHAAAFDGTFNPTVSITGLDGGSLRFDTTQSQLILDLEAGELYWDTNSSTAGTSATGSGNWPGSSVWSYDATGASGTSGWVDGAVVTFSAGATGTGLQTVTVGAAVAVAELTIEEGTVRLQDGGTGTIASTGSVTVQENAAAIFNVPVSAAAFDVEDGGTLGGSATLGGSVTIQAGGVLAPGD